MLKATKFGNICPQLEIYDGFNIPSTTEDCLNLNVFVPPGAGAAARGLPVMFWIFGGGFAGGESNDYNASKLATQGNVVIVTINYRVGILGNLAHPALAAEDRLHSNYSIMDQQFALKWVKKNIRAFGGDPDNVTIFGESAGGVSVYSQLASPLAANLFQKAIVESGSFAGLLKNRSEAVAEVAGQEFAVKVGCTDQTLTCLRSLSVETILKNQGSYSTQPVVDGKVLSVPFDTAFSTGQFNRVPSIQGTNHDELRWSVAFGYDLSGAAATATDYQNVILQSYSTAAAQVEKEYPLYAYSSADVAIATIQTDAGVSCAAPIVDAWLAQYAPVYGYEFDDPSPPIYLPAVSFQTGAAHTTELQFLWPKYHGGEGLSHALSFQEKLLSDRMVNYWTNFAWSGRPASNSSYPWPAFTSESPQIEFLLLSRPKPSLNLPQEHHCGFWNKILGWPANL